MKRASLMLLLGTVLLGNASALTPEQTGQQYGEDLLKLYAQAKPEVRGGEMADLECARLKPAPAAVKHCTLHVWGTQATAEIVYQVAGNPLNNWRRMWVGEMRGLPSDAQAKAPAKALAAEEKAWVKSPAGKSWFAAQDKKRSLALYGYRLNCTVFSKKALPAGVAACFEGPGSADGPTLTLRLADGRTFSADVR